MLLFSCSIPKDAMFMKTRYHLFVLVYAKQEKCQQLGIVKQGFTLKVNEDSAKRLLGHAKSIKECIALSCNSDNANYAVLEKGKCHALYCKKNACQISKDAKSQQKIVGLKRRSKSSAKHSKKQNKSSHKKSEYVYHNYFLNKKFFIRII